MKITLTYAIAMWLASTCATGSPQNPEPVRKGSTADSIIVSPGDTFKIEFTIKPGTGFSWSRPDTLYQHFVFQHEDASQIPGSEVDQKQTFWFVAKSLGVERIKFLYLRPFERPWRSDSSKTLTVIIN